MRIVVGVLVLVGAVAAVGVGCVDSVYKKKGLCDTSADCDSGQVCFLGVCAGGDAGVPDGFDVDQLIGNDSGFCNASNQCGQDKPICKAFQCEMCSGPGDDAECKNRSDATPRCNVATGQCVECMDSTDCKNPNPVCNKAAHTCGRCVVHSECATGVCKEDGSCAGPDDIAYVNNADGTCQDTPHVSTPGKGPPYCQIQTAATLSSLRYVLVTGNGTGKVYNAINLTATTVTGDITVTIVGPGKTAATRAVVFQSMVPALIVTASGKSVTATVDGLDLVGDGGGVSPANSVSCSASAGTATLTLRDSLVHDGKLAVSSNGCTLTLDRDVITANKAGGVQLIGTTYSLTNDIIALNGLGATPGVSIDNTSTQTAFAFNTIAMNQTSGGGVGGVDCIGAPRALESSIVFGNTAPSGSQLGSQCMVTNVVTGTTDNKGTMLTPVFVSGTDFHLKAGDAANAACCVDKVAGPNIDHDVDGERRPGGASTLWDIGADELQ